MSLLDIGTELRHERYFDSHPRVGGDTVLNILAADHLISIRTPAWGGDRSSLELVRLLMHFNSHPRVGGDPMLPSAVDESVFQFAPPRGGDPSGAAAATTASYFNSHPRVGVTGSY